MWFNPIMKWILKSPLHSLMSGSTMLVTFKGRKSGKVYTTPVNYLEIGDALYTISSRDRVWWRNLREGAEVELRFRGEEVSAEAVAIEELGKVEAELSTFLKAAPKRAKYFGVQVDTSGVPDVEDVRRLSEEKVVVKMELLRDSWEGMKQESEAPSIKQEIKESETWQKVEKKKWGWVWIHADWHYLPSS